MKKVSVIHCADIHFDSECRINGVVDNIRTEERRDSFERILEICRDEKIEILLIAGDLFDSPDVDRRIAKRVRDGLAKCPDTNIFITPGNHDYIYAGSIYSNERFWPENVYIFKNEWEYVECENVNVYGAAFTRLYEDSTLIPSHNVIDNQRINIGVLHGDMQAQSRYNPIRKEDIANSNLDYLALGHIHKSTPIMKSGNTSYSYCGCHDGRGFDESGVKGIYKGYVYKDGCDMEFIPINSRQYITMRVDVSGMSESDIIDCINSSAKGTDKDIYQIALAGIRDELYPVNIELIKTKLHMYSVQFAQKYRYNFDYDMIATQNNAKGTFVRRIMESYDIEDETVKKVLEIGVMAFENEVKYREN